MPVDDEWKADAKALIVKLRAAEKKTARSAPPTEEPR